MIFVVPPRSSWMSITGLLVSQAPRVKSGMSIEADRLAIDGVNNHNIEVMFEWDTAFFSQYYKLEISENEGFTDVVISVDSIISTNYLIPSLSYSTTYYWRVRAINELGEGDWSVVWSFATLSPTDAPSLSSPGNNAQNQPVSLTLQWEPLEFAQTYGIQVSESPQMLDLVVNIVEIEKPSFELSELEYEKTYYWRVNATNEAGSGDWSEIWSFSTAETPIPQSVKLLSPQKSIILTQNDVIMDWEPALPSANNYTLEIARDNTFADIVQSSVTSETSLTLTNINPYIKYYWRVKAVNEFGEGPYSDVYSFYLTTSFISTAGEIISGVSKFSDDIFFASSKDDKVYSFDGTGNILWTVETGGALQSTIAVDKNGSIFVGSTDTRLYSFDKDGIPRWDRALGGTILSSPSIGEQDVIFIGISTGRFFAVSKESGNVVWSIQTDDRILSSASIDNDGIVYFGSNDGKLYSVNHLGVLIWSYQTGGAITGSPALTISGEIVFPSQDGGLYKVDSSGNLVRVFETEAAISSSPVIRADGVILFGSEDNNVYAVSENGELIWSFNLGSPVNGTPALTADGLLVIGSDDGMISFFSSEGGLIRQLRTGGAIKAPVLINEDGSIHVSSTDGYVYIIESPEFQNLSKQLSGFDDPIHQWSTFKGNNRRTGNQADLLEMSTQIDFDHEDLLTRYELHQNYPNPFNPSTIISYSLPEQTNVRIEIFNSLGQRVAILVNETKPAGRNNVNFNAPGLSSGLYLYRLQAAQFVKSRQMLFVK